MHRLAESEGVGANEASPLRELEQKCLLSVFDVCLLNPNLVALVVRSATCHPSPQLFQQRVLPIGHPPQAFQGEARQVQEPWHHVQGYGSVALLKTVLRGSAAGAKDRLMLGR